MPSQFNQSEMYHQSLRLSNMIKDLKNSRRLWISHWQPDVKSWKQSGSKRVQTRRRWARIQVQWTSFQTLLQPWLIAFLTSLILEDTTVSRQNTFKRIQTFKRSPVIALYYTGDRIRVYSAVTKIKKRQTWLRPLDTPPVKQKLWATELRLARKTRLAQAISRSKSTSRGC